LKIIKSYFSENLVRPVYDKLTEKCQKFVTENLLQHGDIILQLIFQDNLSKNLSVTAKHIVYRRWSIREERTLQRYLNTSSQNIVRLSLPGKVDDKILGLIATNCQLLEELDLSSSYMTDTGLLALCGVEVTKVQEVPGQSSRPSERGEVDVQTGKFVRAAASRAKRSIRTICANHQQNSFLQELAQGSSATEVMQAKFPHLAAKMRPLLVKREEETHQASWAGEDGLQYRFTERGCRRLRKLDLWSTSFPKKMITRYGDILTVGVSQDAMLAALILCPRLLCLKRNDLGDILQLYHFVYQANNLPQPSLGLTFFSESRLTLDKLSVARKICTSISSLDISMFNFSFVNSDTMNTSDVINKFSESSKLLFEFERLKDLEIQYMDDSKIFHNCLKTSASKLTRLCLNKMISVSFETLSAIKTFCPALTILDIYVDQVFTFMELTPIEQVIAETPNTTWPSLKSLKLGGSIPTGEVLKFLIHGCSNLEVLCYSLYEGHHESITDSYIRDLFEDNNMEALTTFYCEKSDLSELTFFYLAGKLSKLKYVGVMSEWGGLSRRGVLAIKSFILGNNLSIDVDSLQDQYYL